MDETNEFYLGREFDLQEGRTTDQRLLYDPDDLTTHAVVVGMTGSGKTGLCIDMIEEAALNGIPALMFDPKGDITNALLHFPDLRPADFQPWVNADQARRNGQTVEQAAAEAARRWREGLAQWEIGPERLRALKNSVQYAVFTPGSDAGLPVNILASFKAPPLDWEIHRESLREKISATVTALLGLVGVTDADPVRSREHILLSNIFEQAWSQGRDLNLSELILQTQTPPFQKLGVFPIDTFFPEKDRFALAMTLNNILAAPSFQSWIEGQPLDVPALLYTPDGRPRHSVFYLAHLPDAERMFFVTLLFSAVESWMRTQTGSDSLRTILYFDEIFGYLPPVANPPSKGPMLRMLKQARAFGVGLVLATQNPVDVDYKALSNAGTWMIGKLQTDQDKQRLLDGLEGALSGGLDRSAAEQLITGLDKRVFLLHNVHAREPVVFQTRWAMNYLAGPLTRVQIPALNRLAGATAAPTAGQPESASIPLAASAAADLPAAPAPEPPTAAGSVTRPAVPSGITEYFLPHNLTPSEALQAAEQSAGDTQIESDLLYRPVLLAQAEVRFIQRKYNLDTALRRAVRAPEADLRAIRWETLEVKPVDPAGLDPAPISGARFASLGANLTDARLLKSMERDFTDWLFYDTRLTIRANEALKVFAGPDTGAGEFARLCHEAAGPLMQAELDKTSASFESKLDRLQERLVREQRELDEDQTELSQRKQEELGTHAENLLSLFGGRRRRLTTSLSKRRMTERAKADVKESEEAIADFERQLEALEAEKAEALQAIEQRWTETARQITEIPLSPYKKDIRVELFGVAWMPFYVVRIADRVLNLPAYG